MIESMTGFGQAERTIGGFAIRIEVRSVNHRYLETVVRFPRDMTRFEDLIKRTVQGRLKRGRIEVFLSIEREAETAGTPQVDWAKIEGYWAASAEIAERLGLPHALQLGDLLQVEGIFVQEPALAVDDEALEEKLRACLEEALDGVAAMRRREGDHLRADLLSRLLAAQSLHASIQGKSGEAVRENKDKLRERIRELLENPHALDEQRFQMEVAVMAERMDVQEELTRLSSHFKQFRSMLEQREPVGRKLDFLVQEMNREANTIGSKANHASITAWIVDLKAELEKIREQVQNIQ
ncbi:YicC/YloC family endoribonuclease [Xylanibacillus composti]|uniref:YicC family protein n=1 Tax=Xylanibacillus composti TaxID=1572762 RepID=A0A8J4GYR5_9BACL|nr:YicC/YloC family endoribonuclease [Xylanibacillus composti]GIQ67682.1 hypothetical protein XYCOK13_05060 [Xylanibacillus composti]